MNTTMNIENNSTKAWVVIFGATSAIAYEVAKIHAERGYRIALIGRSPEKIEVLAQDLRVRGSKDLKTFICDLNDNSAHQHVINSIFELGIIDRILFAHGTLPNQKDIEDSVEATMQCIQDNALSTIRLLTLIAPKMVLQKRGLLAVISSVAGDRGRKSNYVYGASKGFLTRFCEGLRNRLLNDGVHVLTIKPGFVDTPMTAEFPKSGLWATPQKVGADITKAMDKKRNTIYTPWFWQCIMLIIQHIPEPIFKKLSL